MTTQADTQTGQDQAQRLEAALAEIEAVFNRPGMAERLRQAPGADEWNVLEVLGHTNEMIPYWLGHCRRLVEATGEPPAFGRTLDSPERLEAVERASAGQLDDLMSTLRDEIGKGAAAIRGMSKADRHRAGIHNRRGHITVAEVIESFVVSHAEEHVAQIQAALGAAN